MSDEGQIGEIDLIQRLVDLGRERFTGAIRFEQDGIIKIVYFKDGDVLSASTNDRTDAVDEILFRAGKVSKEHIKQALSKRKEHESLGDALLNLGFITRKELAWGRRIQVIGILRSVRTWDHGQYAIVADYLPKREEGTLFPLQQIIIELYVTEQDRQTFERALSGGSVVLAKTDDFDAAFQKLGLNEEAAEIASKIDGNRSAADIVAATGKDAFNTYKLLEALRVLGLLRKEEKPQAEDELGFASIGVADAEDSMWRRTQSGRMPVPEFQTEPEPPVEPTGEEAPPPPVAIATANPAEVEWGFDEAQIEAATKAAAPPPPPKTRATPTQTQTRRPATQFARPAAKKSRQLPVFAIVVLLIVAAAAFGGWYWWKGQQPAAATPIATTPKPAAAKSQPVVSAEVGGHETPVVPAPAPAPAAVSQPAPPPAPVVKTSGAKFTLQIELVCQQASLAKAQQIGGASVWSAPITYRDKQCHRVFWGRYPTREEAETATSQIPAELRASKPVVVTIPQ